MQIRINIALKKAVLDTQGKAIEASLNKNLGYSQITNVRQGKFVDIEISENDQDKIKDIVDDICDKLLVNKIIEDYSYHILKN
jgi:phosphoribosylformylglycinamidine synthase PurS subunit